MFRCKVCGWIHEGAAPPDECPSCGAPADRFRAMDSAEVGINSFCEHLPENAHIVVSGRGRIPSHVVEAYRAAKAETEQKAAKPGTVEAWGRSPKNPVGGWYGRKKDQ